MFVGTGVVDGIVDFLLQIFLWMLIGRIIIDYVMMFSRSWQPRGAMLAVVDAIFAVTDPPLRAVRRFVPPLRFGQVSFDLAFLVLFFGVQILASIRIPF